MSCARSLRAAPFAMLVVAACADAKPTGPVVPDDGPPLTLELFVPAVDAGRLAVWSAESRDSVAARPALTLYGDEESPVPESWSESDSRIYDPRTRAGFSEGSAWAVGQHEYQGNKGQITTTIAIAFEGAEIGSQTAYRENDNPFWLDFGLVKYIEAIARVYTDRECGLTAQGSSKHEAWWEAIPGGSIATFGRVVAWSTSDPARQPDCPPPTSQTGGGGGGGGGPEGMYCWVSIWYDQHSGEVLQVDVLWCETGG